MKTQSNLRFELGLESLSQNDNFDRFAYFNWYLMMARQGYARAQYALARCYEQGIGVAKNEAEAQKWYAKANTSYGNEELHESDAIHANGFAAI